MKRLRSYGSWRFILKKAKGIFMVNFIFILSSVLLNSAAQILMRKGMLDVGAISTQNLINSAFAMVQNLWLWGAMMSYAISILLWMLVLSRVQVSYAYPFLSIGYIVAAVVGYLWMGETMDMYKVFGIGIICLGIVVLSQSSN